MAIDTKAIKEHIRGILIALGDDPDREGLKDTPDRVARMYNEASHCCKVFSVNQHIIAVGNAIKTQMLIMSDICLPAHAEGKISQCLPHTHTSCSVDYPPLSLHGISSDTAP